MVLILAILHCLAFVDRTMIGGALPLIRQSIAMDDAQAGWLIGPAFAIPYGVTALLLAAGSRGRRASTRWLVGAVVVWTVGGMSMAAASDIAGLTLARVLLGIGQGMFVPVAIAVLVDRAATDARARALASFTSGSTIGRSTALLATGALLALLTAAHGADTAPWRSLFLLTALPNLVILPLLIGVPAGPAAPVGIPSKHDRAIDWPVLTTAMLLAIVPVLLFQAIAGWLPSLFVRDRALTPQLAATLIGAVTLVAAPASQFLGSALVGGRIRYRAQPSTFVLAGMVATLPPLAAICWAPGLTVALCSVAVLNLTLGSASFCALFAVQSQILPEARIGVNGVYFALVTLVGLGLGPLLTGILANAGGGTALRDAMMLTGIISCGLCALVTIAARYRYRYRHRAWA